MQLAAFLAALLLVAAPALAQTPPPDAFVPAPLPQPAVPTAPTTATPTPGAKQPLSPGSMTMRLNGRLTMGAGVASDSGR